MKTDNCMWIADQWKDYELIDCSKGEKLERWRDVYLVRPDPQAIWDTSRMNRHWQTRNARAAEAAGRRERFPRPGRCVIKSCASE